MVANLLSHSKTSELNYSATFSGCKWFWWGHQRHFIVTLTHEWWKHEEWNCAWHLLDPILMSLLSPLSSSGTINQVLERLLTNCYDQIHMIFIYSDSPDLPPMEISFLDFNDGLASQWMLNFSKLIWLLTEDLSTEPGICLGQHMKHCQQESNKSELCIAPVVD